MKLHYALAALAVAAMSFGASAQTANLLEGAIPHDPEGQTPYDKGWRFKDCKESDFQNMTSDVTNKFGYRTSCVNVDGEAGNETVLYATWQDKKYAYPVSTAPMKVYKLSGHMWRRNGGSGNVNYKFYLANNINGENPISQTQCSTKINGDIVDLGSKNLRLYVTEGTEQIYFLWEVTGNNPSEYGRGGLAEDVKLEVLGDLATVKFITNCDATINPVYFLNGEKTSINQPSVSNGNLLLEGWYTDETCTATNKVSFPFDVTEDVTLYAKWTTKAEVYGLMAGWDGTGIGVTADHPDAFGWIATPNVEWSDAYTGGGEKNGYRDDINPGTGIVRALFKKKDNSNSVFAYPVNNLESGKFYQFNASAAFMNKDNVTHTFNFNSQADGAGESYASTSVTVSKKWNDFGTVNCYFEVPVGVTSAYMCWTNNNTSDRAFSWGYSLKEVSFEEVFNAKKAEAETLLANTNVTGVEKTNLENAMAATEYTYASVKALMAAIDNLNAAAPSYNAWAAVKNAAESEAVKSLYEGADVQYMNPLNAALEGPASAEAALQAANDLKTLVADAIMGKVLGAGVDMTSEIKGALITNGEDPAAHWTSEKATNDPEGSDEGIKLMRVNQGEHPEVWDLFSHYYDTDNYELTQWSNTLTQTLNLPAGDYTIAVMCRSAAFEHDYTMTIGEESIALHSQGNAGQELGRGWARVYKSFKVTASEQGAQNMPSLAAEEVKKYPVTLKVHTSVGAANNNWFSFNNFKLVQNKAEDNPTGIEVVEVEENAPAVYYNLNGVRVDGNNLTPGVYVVRRGAKAEKILVK